MNWAQLPRAGGLEDQDPMFLEAVLMAEGERNEHEKRQAKANEAKAKKRPR